MSNLFTLLAKKAEIEAEIVEYRKIAFDELVDYVLEKATIAGIELTEIAAALQTEHNKRLKPVQEKKARAKAPPKWRHEPTGKTWNGLGRKPGWFNMQGVVPVNN